MARSIASTIKWLNDNKAYRLLLHPPVVKNYLNYQREMKEKPLVMRSYPPGVEIELTNRCNLACTQCLRSLGLKGKKLGALDMDQFKHLLDQFPYVMQLSLNGFGEPLMSPILWDAVHYARKARPWCKIILYTNGMFLNEEAIKEALNSPLAEFNISLDGGRAGKYEKVRRGGDLEVITGNIENFLRMRKEAGKTFPRIGLNYVMLNDNEGELPGFIELGAKLGVDSINCITYATYNWGFNNHRTLDNYRAELTEAKKVLDRTGLPCRYFPEWEPEWLRSDRKFMCNFFWGEEFRVACLGDITLGCCSPFREQYSYGNLFENSFWELWNNDLFRANRAAALEGRTVNKVCEDCDKFARDFFPTANAFQEKQGIRELTMVA